MPPQKPSSEEIDLAIWRGTVIEGLKNLDEAVQALFREKASQQTIDEIRGQIKAIIEKAECFRDRCEAICGKKASSEDLKAVQKSVQDLEIRQTATAVRVGFFGAVGGFAASVVLLLVKIVFDHFFK